MEDVGPDVLPHQDRESLLPYIVGLVGIAGWDLEDLIHGDHLEGAVRGGDHRRPVEEPSEDPCLARLQLVGAVGGNLVPEPIGQRAGLIVERDVDLFRVRLVVPYLQVGPLVGGVGEEGHEPVRRCALEAVVTRGGEAIIPHGVGEHGDRPGVDDCPMPAVGEGSNVGHVVEGSGVGREGPSLRRIQRASLLIVLDAHDACHLSYIEQRIIRGQRLTDPAVHRPGEDALGGDRAAGLPGEGKRTAAGCVLVDHHGGC